jgi:aminotransferase
MSAPTMAQIAATEALLHGDAAVQAMVAEYDRRRMLIVGGLNRLGLTTFEPHGAFYAFPQVTITGMDDETFAEKLLQEEHVAVVPGSAFGAGGAGFVRCSYATAYEKIEEALARIERFMRRQG